MAHREFKARLYPQFARVAQAVSSDRRLELLDLLAQAPRHVEALAEATEMPVANVSQHLKVLKTANLVETERQGTRVIHRLASPAVARLLLAVREVAEAHVPEVAIIARQFGLATGESPANTADLLDSAYPGAFLIDVRPRHEYDHGHLPGAHPFPPEELPGRLHELPRDRPIVAYCRGNYCLFADEAVALLREQGFDAHRLDGGWLEWTARQPDGLEG